MTLYKFSWTSAAADHLKGPMILISLSDCICLSIRLRLSVYLYSPAADIEGVQLKGPGPCVSHSKTASG